MKIKPTPYYYTSQTHLSNIFDAEARQLPCQAGSIEAYSLWKATVRAKLREITGISQMKTCDLEPQLLSTAQLEGITREKWLIQTEQDVWMPFYILIPHSANAETPCIIAPHGHVICGKLGTSGRRDYEVVNRQIEEYNADYGLKFAEEGYVVFCPDARAFGERRESPRQGEREDFFICCTCEYLNNIAICLGRSLTGMWTWDLMRLIDYIETREWDASRIACAGLSGGGAQTLWLTALDDRVKCGITSGYFYGIKEALLKLPNCSCNYIPGLWNAVDMGDIAALIAPRPFLVETGIDDPLNGESGLANVFSQVEIARDAYKLFSAEEKLVHVVEEGGHRWYGNKANWFIEINL
ncbi:MAG: alpha/beta hydrolase family protein [Defluviitaleaceae bacterium]|nr:alpha/beta hydrolase family protein [Defluviitaleaceae bacterium]